MTDQGTLGTQSNQLFALMITQTFEIINFRFVRNELTMSTNVVGQEQVKLSDRDIYMIGVDTETRMKTIGRLL